MSYTLGTVPVVGTLIHTGGKRMYRVTAKNGFVVECETVTEVRALLGESPSASVERTSTPAKPARRDRGRAKGKKGYGQRSQI